VAGGEDLAMVESYVLLLEGVEEEFEGVLEVRVRALDLVVRVQVLVREEDALGLHGNYYLVPSIRLFIERYI